MDALLTEIGRAGEITFRDSGEGSAKNIDLDSFDSTYSHLILWDCGGERSRALAWTRDILAPQGVRCLYTNTLFRFKPRFFERFGPAVELGRSFIRSQYQRERFINGGVARSYRSVSHPQLVRS